MNVILMHLLVFSFYLAIGVSTFFVYLLVITHAYKWLLIVKINETIICSRLSVLRLTSVYCNISRFQQTNFFCQAIISFKADCS
jgi:hypothetical protein